MLYFKVGLSTISSPESVGQQNPTLVRDATVFVYVCVCVRVCCQAEVTLMPLKPAMLMWACFQWASSGFPPHGSAALTASAQPSLSNSSLKSVLETLETHLNIFRCFTCSPARVLLIYLFLTFVLLVPVLNLGFDVEMVTFCPAGRTFSAGLSPASLSLLPPHFCGSLTHRQQLLQPCFGSSESHICLEVSSEGEINSVRGLRPFYAGMYFVFCALIRYNPPEERHFLG